MLPETIDKADVKWALGQLSMLPMAYRVTACQAYSKVWRKAFEEEPQERHKENAARYTANKRLREYVEKVTLLSSQQSK